MPLIRFRRASRRGLVLWAPAAVAVLWLALVFSPFMSIAGTVALTWLILRVGFARQLSLSLTITSRRAMWAAIGAAFLLNWVYMIWRDLR